MGVASDLARGMDDIEAVERYDRGGAAGAGRFAGVRWPDLAITPENLRRICEGVLESKVDAATCALGDVVDVERFADDIEEAWRLDGLQARFAPEGVFLQVAFTVRAIFEPDEVGDDASRIAGQVTIEGELCLSFVARQHARPFVDFMGGVVRRAEPEAFEKQIEPFALQIDPPLAVAWGLNGCEPE